MTAKELYEYALIEINKLEAPSLLLSDYVYFINKAVQQYINKVYNRYDVNQQSTDDLRVLKTTAVLDLALDDSPQTALDMLNNTYVCTLPKDYLHILNCIVEYETLSGSGKCDDTGSKVYYPARKLTSDMYPVILSNSYMKPIYKRPYYFLNNVNTQSEVITNSQMDDEVINQAGQGDKATPVYDRTSNISNVRLEIRYGNDASKYRAEKVYIDYIKSPMYIRLTQSQIKDIVDTSQVLEFPDYVCFEIVNEFTKLIMENASDPRVQTNPVVNQTIAAGSAG